MQALKRLQNLMDRINYDINNCLNLGLSEDWNSESNNMYNLNKT